MFLNNSKYRIYLSAFLTAVYLITITANIFHRHNIEVLVALSYEEACGTTNHFSASAYYELNYKCVFHSNFISLTTFYFSGNCFSHLPANQKQSLLVLPKFSLCVDTLHKDNLRRGPPSLV